MANLTEVTIQMLECAQQENSSLQVMDRRG